MAADLSSGDFVAPLPQAGMVVGGKYHLENKVAEGGGGAVWHALDPHGTGIALKFLKWSPLKSKKAAADRFKSEFSILKNLSHPHIGKIHDFGYDQILDLYFFTSELLTAGSLSEMTYESVAVIEDLLLQSLRALEYLRNQGLFHLDIKPQNLLLKQAGKHPHIALIDFGLATFRPPDRPGGTPNYMPPEIIVRRLPHLAGGRQWPAPDHRSDLYSLGVTFYALLTGVQPFRRNIANHDRIDGPATMAAHLEHTPPPPSEIQPEIPRYLDRIIMKLMARHPDDRYPTAAVAAQAIQFRSPRRHSPESQQTLLAYLPKEGRLIGRHEERKIIAESCQAVVEGIPHAPPVIALTGGRGMGKSRLLETLKTFAQQHEMGISWIDATNPSDSARLDEILEEVASDRPRVHAFLIDNVHHLVNGNHGHPDAEALLDGLLRLIRQLKLQTRIADKAARRYFFAFTFDTDRRSLSRALLDLDLDETICHVVPLKNFTNAEISEYLTNVLGETPERTAVESLRKATDGNPLFITEQLEQMIARGKLFSLAGRPDAKTLKAIGLDFAQATPSHSLQNIILDEYRSLPEKVRAVAQILACWGRPVELSELEGAGLHADAARELMHLVNMGLVQRRPTDGCYTFANAMAAKIIATHLPKNLRTKWHDAIAALLTKRNTFDRTELDSHLAHGSDQAMRLAALKRLAHEAMATNHATATIEYLQLILDELPKEEWKERAQVMKHLGQAFDRSRQHDVAIETFRNIEKIHAPTSCKRELCIRSWEQIGLSALRRRELAAARRMFEKALKLLTNTRHHLAWRLRLQNFIAAVLLRGGHAKKARLQYENSWIAASTQLTDEEVSLITNNELGEATLMAGLADDAIPILERELKEALQTANSERIASRHYLLGEAYRHKTVQAETQALDHYRQGLQIATNHHHLDLEVRIHNGMGNLYEKNGNYIEAAEHYRTALHLAEQTESETVTVELMVNLGFLCCRIRQPADAVEYLEAALDFSGGPKGTAGVFIRRKRPEIFIALGDALYQQRDFNRAEEYLEGALRYEREGMLTPAMRYSLYGTLSEVSLARGDRKRAAEYLPSLRELVTQVPEARSHFDHLMRQLS